MAYKAIVLFSASALFIQAITAQCIGPIPGVAPVIEEFAIAGNAYGAPLVNYASGPVISNPYGFVPSSGGSFVITSTSSISPTGITVISENAIEGPVSIAGDLPFLGSVAFESALATAGAGAINYSCGTGAVGIVGENIAPAAYGPGPAYGPMAPAAAAPGRLALGAGVAPGLVGPGLAYNRAGCGL